jgi:hypothetical protein
MRRYAERPWRRVARRERVSEDFIQLTFIHRRIRVDRNCAHQLVSRDQPGHTSHHCSSLLSRTANHRCRVGRTHQGDYLARTATALGCSTVPALVPDAWA